MTACDCTVSSTVSKNISYSFPVYSNPDQHCVAEDTDDYTVKPVLSDELPWVMKRIELKALRKTGSGQIGRIYQLTNLLLQPEPIDRTADELKRFALEIREAASSLENILHAIIGPIIDEPEE